MLIAISLAGVLAACTTSGESAEQANFHEARDAFRNGEMTIYEWEPIVNSYVADFSINSIAGTRIVEYQTVYDQRWVRREEFPELDMYEVVPRLTEEQVETFFVELNFGDADGLMALLEGFGVFDAAFFDTRQSAEDTVSASGDGDTDSWSDWAETAYGTFDTIRQSGSGYVRIDLPEEVGPAFVIDFAYSGPRIGLASYLTSAPYDVQYLIALDDDEVSSGTVVTGLEYANSAADREDGDHYFISLVATGEGDVGDWTITVRPIASLTTYDSTSINPEISGSGPTVFIYDDVEPTGVSSAVEGEDQGIALKLTSVPDLGYANVGGWRSSSDSGSGAFWLEGGHMIVEVQADNAARWRLYAS